MSVKPNGASGEVRPWGEVTPVPAESRMPVWGAPAPTPLPAFAAAPAINPFAQPTGSAEAPYPQPGTGYPSAAYPMAGAPAVSTESIASTGNGVCRLLWLLFLGRLITLIAGGYEHIVVGHYLENPVGTDVSGLATIDRIIRWTGYVELLVAVMLAIRFCIWIYRATRNAVAFNPQIARVPPWLAVVLCLTPLVNFVAPYFVVSMALSAAETPLGTTRSRGSSMLLVSWWASVLAQVVLVVLLEGRTTTLQAYYDHQALALVALGLSLVTIGLVIAVISRVSAAHDQRRAMDRRMQPVGRARAF